MRSCSVTYCHSTSLKVKLFSIPRQPALQQLWVELLKPHCKIPKRSPEARRLHLKVCILHFEEKFILPYGRRAQFAYPTLFTEEEIKTKQPQHTYSICTENIVAYKEYVEHPLPIDTSAENYKFRRILVEHTYCKPKILKMVLDKVNSELDKPVHLEKDKTYSKNETSVPASQESQAPNQSVSEYFAKFQCDLTDKETSTDNPIDTQDPVTYIPCEDEASVSDEIEILDVEIVYDECQELTSNDEGEFLNEKLDNENLKLIYDEETLGDENLEITNTEEIEYLDENLKLTNNEDTSGDQNLELTNNEKVPSNHESCDVNDDLFVVKSSSKTGTVDEHSQVSLEQLRECKSKQVIYTSVIRKQTRCINKQAIYTSDVHPQKEREINTSDIPQETECENKQAIYTSGITLQTECENKRAIYTSGIPQQTECENKEAIYTSVIHQQTECENKEAIYTSCVPQKTECENKQAIYTSVIHQQTECENKQAIYTSGIPLQTECENKQSICTSGIPQHTECENKQAFYILNTPPQTGCQNKPAIYILNLPQQTLCDNKQTTHTKQIAGDNKQAIYTLNIPQQTGSDNNQDIYPFNIPPKTGSDNKQAMFTLNLPQQTVCDNKPTMHTLTLPQQTGMILQRSDEHANVHIDIPNIMQSTTNSVELQAQQELNETKTDGVSVQEDSSLKTEENNEIADQIFIQTCKPILTEGLKKDVKEKLLQQYQVPENCIPLITPTLNPIVMAVASEKVKNREKYLQSKQDQLGAGIAAINEAYQCILHNDIQKTVQALYDSCAILSDLHYTGTMERKQLIAPALKRKFASLFQNQETDELNFKDELVKTLKSLKTNTTKKRQTLDTRNQTLVGNQIRSKKGRKRKEFHQDPN